MEKQKLLVVCGPTASGKTRLAVDIALKFGGEVVSADSMQVYRGMDIGTAKPTMQETRGVPHHMMNCAQPGTAYGAAVYRDRARECISEISSRGRLPILCGGTGLYISAVVYPLDFAGADADGQLRQELQSLAERHGVEALHEKLKQADPDAAASIHPNNVRRVIRALEKAHAPGGSQDTGQSLFNGEPLYDLAWIGLTMNRQALYQRIDVRVDEMMARGHIDEVRGLTAVLRSDSTAFQAIGYKELLAYINGKTTLKEAVEQIKSGTRNYAKRQMTWFKRESSIRWFDIGDFDSLECMETAVFGYIRSSLHMSEM